MNKFWNRVIILAHRQYRLTEKQIDKCTSEAVRELLVKRLIKYRNIEYYAVERLNRVDNLIVVDFQTRKRVA